MDPSELEEGELTDSGDETGEINGGSSSNAAADTNECTLLPRPTNPALSFRIPQESLPPTHTFRDSTGVLGADSDADSDCSDDGEILSKRFRMQPHHQPIPPATSALKKKRNVWADVLIEQQISSKIKSSGNIVTDEVDTVERGVESYNPSGESRTISCDMADEVELDEGELWDVNEDGESVNTAKKRVGKRKKKKRKKVKDRLDLDYHGNGHDYDRIDKIPDEICADDDERVIARYVARNLNEPKMVLIERVARFAGRQKTLDLFNATIDVEAAGGMMTCNGEMRRTPGGVFIQLLKKDKGISKDTIRDIFAIERENQKFAKKLLIMDHQNRKRKYYKKSSTNQTAGTSESSETKNEMEAEEELDLMEEPDIEIGVDC